MGIRRAAKTAKRIPRPNLAGVTDRTRSNLARNLGKSSQENIEKLYNAQDKIRAAAKKEGLSVKQYRLKNPNNTNVKTLYRLKPNIKAKDLNETGLRVYGGHYGK